jgi:hypothetical protein
MPKFKTGDKVILNRGRHSTSEMGQYFGNVATVTVYDEISYLFAVEENEWYWDEDTCELAIDSKFKGMLPEEEFADA